jgi:hypothetical protein
LEGEKMATYKRYLTHNFLVEQYVNQRRSCLDIGREVGCSGVTVHSYLKKFKIPRRSRLEAISKKIEEKQKLTKEEKMKRREKLIAKANKLIAEVRLLQDRMKYPLSATEKEANRLKAHAKVRAEREKQQKLDEEFSKRQRGGGKWHVGDVNDQLYDIMEHTRDKS